MNYFNTMKVRLKVQRTEINQLYTYCKTIAVFVYLEIKENFKSVG